MADEIKYVTGMQIIEMMAPLVGIDPGDVKMLDVRASYDDVAVFTVCLLGKHEPFIVPAGVVLKGT